MLKAFGDVNWLAVAAADVVLFAFGAVWFLFVVARAYRIALELEGEPQKPSALFIAGPFLCQSIVIATTAVLIRALGITTYAGALQFGLIVGLGYLLPMVVNIAINPKFPKPLFYSLINAPFFVLSSLIASTILVAVG